MSVLGTLVAAGCATALSLLAAELRAEPNPPPKASCPERQRQGWDLRPEPGAARPCRVIPRKPPEHTSDGVAFGTPYHGLGLRLDALFALGSEARAGVGLEAGLSHHGERWALGVSGLAMWLWASESGSWFSNPVPRKNRDRLTMPRLRTSLGLDHEGFWRMHAVFGFGPTSLLMEGGGPDAPQIRRSVWSYDAGLGLSGGVWLLELHSFGYMNAVERFDWSILGTSHASSEPRGTPGLVVTFGIGLPLVLSGRERPPAAAPDLLPIRRRPGKWR